MTLSLGNEDKNSLSITNENKDYGITWDEATFSWDDAAGTWDVPGLIAPAESKNSLTITNEDKN